MSSRWRDIADMASAELQEPSPLKQTDFSGPLPSLRTPQRPFGSGLEGLPAAYKRAGLGSWATELASEVIACCILWPAWPPSCSGKASLTECSNPGVTAVMRVQAVRTFGVYLRLVGQ